MSFLEFLQGADMSALSGFSALDILFSSGLGGLLSLLLGMAGVVVAVVGLVVRPMRFIPLILGLLSFLTALLGVYNGYSMVSMRVAEAGGWQAAEQVELAQAAALCIPSLVIGLVWLGLGLLGSVANVFAYRVRAKGSKSET